MTTILNSLSGLTMRPPEPFSGLPADNYRVEEFLTDIDNYITTTGKNTPATFRVEGADVPNPNYGKIEREVLRTSLTGPAKSWYRQQKDTTSFEDLKKGLKKRFQLTNQQKHVRKIGIFQLTQKPAESFLEYLSRVSDKARGIGIKDKDIITIVTQGAHPSIRPFLIMENVDSLEDLMDLPLARDETQARRQEAEFVNAADLETFEEEQGHDPTTQGYREYDDYYDTNPQLDDDIGRPASQSEYANNRYQPHSKENYNPNQYGDD